jgi:hypothetical protein
MDSGTKITGGGSALLAHAGGVQYGTELGSMTLKRVVLFCFSTKSSTHTAVVQVHFHKCFHTKKPSRR